MPGTMALPLGLLLAALGCAAALDSALEEAWRGWKSLHAKEYPEDVEAARREVWEKNLRRIEEHNREQAQGRHTFRLGMNHYGDLTDEEFNQLLNGFAPGRQQGPGPLFRASAALRTPAEVDWRAKGYVTPVKNQGHCGSCWAFSATGALEGLVFNRTRKLVVLSEQNLIDCSRKLGNEGCGGGYVTRAFQYVHDNGGLNSEHVYPYLGTDASSCRYDPRDRAANCSAVRLVAPGSEAALEQAVAAVGPVSVAVDASSFHFHFYESGIFSSAFCSQRVNHAMLAVGYGTSQQNGQSVAYWILKNSWSEVWGERGYIRLLKGVDNHCGVANQASFPVL
ncbi:cathepsin L1-like isoform X2 [Apteryx rowi]|uniref:cathepsin L1-like isoform X2 n=1 Tax=Apteryx rowi TaxID=308060 RepID=UPI000E1C918D|nr:cathepsin L1-like isoform X2 [Apteryx rowi]